MKDKDKGADNMTLYFRTFRPTQGDSFRMVRVPGSTLWTVQVIRLKGDKVEMRALLDPPDRRDIIERKAAGLMQEAELRRDRR